ncbi:alpha/beta hydrolase [Ramlibacter monticola]|uniref:Alpha/beta hydrolase n=1 Tax=Ramlibacter monticola TaxID=1926872 RepID=A0A936Z2Q5_9BURK|nr:alpha/beta hydrolase [Ramlibacter monticola]MBL0393965.1 alpha/beta hydrolase [Ramlibacter monticola]
MPSITTDDGVRLHCEDTGSGTPIVFVHEFAGDGRSWEPQVRHFARRYRCVTYNARGYPPSDVPEDFERYSQERVREDLRCVIEALGLQLPHVVGLSMGAFATLHFGMRYCAQGAPARARSLTLAGCGTGAHPAAYATFQADARALADGIARHGMEHFAATYGHGPARLQLRAKDPRGFAEYARQLAGHSATGSANTMRGYQARRPCLYELTQEMARIDVPVLVMAGDEDEPCLEPSLLIKRTVAKAGLALLPRSGHAINLEEPALFNRLLEDFLHQVESGRWPARDAASRPSIWGPAGKP